MSMTTAETFSSYTVDKLKQFCDMLDSKPGSKRKADLVAHVSGELTSRLDELVGRLDTLQKAAIAHIAHDRWEAYDADRFYAIHGATPNWGERERWSSWIREPSLLALFIHGGTIPKDLHARLRELVDPIPPRRLNSFKELPDATVAWFDYDTRTTEKASVTPHVYAGEQVALLEVVALLNLATLGKLTTTAKTKMPTAATVRRVSDVLVAPEPLSDPDEWFYEGLESDLELEDCEVGPLRAHALAWMLLHTKLTSGKALSKKGKALLTGPPHEAIKALWEQWCAQDARDELELIKPLKGYAKARRKLTAPSSRRAHIVDALRGFEVGAWIEVEDWLDQMRAEERFPAVTRPGEDAWELYIDHSNYGSLGYDNQTTYVLVPAYVNAFLFACAASLGIVDIAYVSPDTTHTAQYWWSDSVHYLSPFEGLHAIRLTPLGAWVLGVTKDYTPQVAPVDLRVLPNRDVVVLGGATPGVTGLLDVYATMTSEHTWHLERDALLRALEEGHDLERLRGFLTEHSTAPLPPAVAALLDDVARRATLVSRGGDATLFEVADPVVAAEIAHDRRTANLCRLLGDRTLVVAKGDMDRFQTALRGLGYSAGV